VLRGLERRLGCSSCRTRPTTVDLESIRGTFDERLSAESGPHGLEADDGGSHFEKLGTPHLLAGHRHGVVYSFIQYKV